MIPDAVAALSRRIRLACERSGRSPDCVKVVAVAKGRSADEISQALAAGLTDIGENRIQEALEKYRVFQATPGLKPARWHLVGRLQTNKVRDAVRIFDCIQSVDSLRLAGAIDAEAARAGKVQDILVQVNASGEATKSGFEPGQTVEAVETIARFTHLNIAGLMTIAAQAGEPERARPCFRLLRELRDAAARRLPAGRGFEILSMGMSGDFEVAVEEGSTLVRVGTALFGARPAP